MDLFTFRGHLQETPCKLMFCRRNSGFGMDRVDPSLKFIE